MPENKDFKFDKRASSYDDGVEGKASGKFYRVLLEQVKAIPGMSLLDVGCGTGTILRRIADKTPIQGFGIDVEEQMILAARKKCPDMDIRVSPCEHTPFNNQQFDAITACMAYHHFSDKKGFAEEAARILKPGGAVYIADPRFPLIIRKAMNGILKLLRLEAFFGTPDETYETFRAFGFQLDGVTKDSYVQVVKMKRI
jgi:ubiquinone/menaquinone biosynthesis C-methylase UbiE